MCYLGSRAILNILYMFMGEGCYHHMSYNVKPHVRNTFKETVYVVALFSPRSWKIPPAHSRNICLLLISCPKNGNSTFNLSIIGKSFHIHDMTSG